MWECEKSAELVRSERVMQENGSAKIECHLQPRDLGALPGSKAKPGLFNAMPMEKSRASFWDHRLEMVRSQADGQNNTLASAMIELIISHYYDVA